LAAAQTAAWVEHITDFHCVGHHWHRKFPLRAIFPFHDLTDPEAAVVRWYVRLLPVSGWFDGSKCGRRLMVEGQMVQSGELHTVVEELWP